MADQASHNSTTPDPPIYKHLNAKTAGILRQVNRHQQEHDDEAAAVAQETTITNSNTNNMASEQTYERTQTATPSQSIDSQTNHNPPSSSNLQLHRHQARRRPTWPDRRHHLTIRETRLQACGPEASDTVERAHGETLRGPSSETLL